MAKQVEQLKDTLVRLSDLARLEEYGSLAEEALDDLDGVSRRLAELETHCQHLEKAIEIAELEKIKALTRESRVMRILARIIALLPPKPIETEQGMFAYVDPNAMENLNMLRDRIWAIMDDVEAAVEAECRSVGDWQ